MPVPLLRRLRLPSPVPSVHAGTRETRIQNFCTTEHISWCSSALKEGAGGNKTGARSSPPSLQAAPTSALVCRCRWWASLYLRRGDFFSCQPFVWRSFPPTSKCHWGKSPTPRPPPLPPFALPLPLPASRLPEQSVLIGQKHEVVLPEYATENAGKEGKSVTWLLRNVRYFCAGAEPVPYQRMKVTSGTGVVEPLWLELFFSFFSLKTWPSWSWITSCRYACYMFQISILSPMTHKRRWIVLNLKFIWGSAGRLSAR